MWEFCGEAQFPQSFGRIGNCYSTKFPHQKIWWNYRIFRSAIHDHLHHNYFKKLFLMCYILLTGQTSLSVVLTLRYIDDICVPAGVYLFKVSNRKVWNMFKVNNKDTRTTSYHIETSLLICGTNQCTGCSVSIVDFEHVIASWGCNYVSNMWRFKLWNYS